MGMEALSILQDQAKCFLQFKFQFLSWKFYLPSVLACFALVNSGMDLKEQGEVWKNKRQIATGSPDPQRQVPRTGEAALTRDAASFLK